MPLVVIAEVVVVIGGAIVIMMLLMMMKTMMAVMMTAVVVMLVVVMVMACCLNCVHSVGALSAEIPCLRRHSLLLQWDCCHMQKQVLLFGGDCGISLEVLA